MKTDDNDCFSKPYTYSYEYVTRLLDNEVDANFVGPTSTSLGTKDYFKYEPGLVPSGYTY